MYVNTIPIWIVFHVYLELVTKVQPQINITYAHMYVQNFHSIQTQRAVFDQINEKQQTNTNLTLTERIRITRSNQNIQAYMYDHFTRLFILTHTQ